MAVVMLFLFAGCSRNRQPVTDAITNRDSVPVMVTRDVSTYVSDSGVVRYKIVTDEWQVFDRLDPSRWAFEQGIYLEKFNNALSVEAVIVADTAYYYDKQELWELRGNVHIENEQDEQFDTQLLFWNQKTKRVYSEQFIRRVWPRMFPLPSPLRLKYAWFVRLITVGASDSAVYVIRRSQSSVHS